LPVVTVPLRPDASGNSAASAFAEIAGTFNKEMGTFNVPLFVPFGQNLTIVAKIEIDNGSDSNRTWGRVFRSNNKCFKMLAVDCLAKVREQR
jgi:hypothetical protein